MGLQNVEYVVADSATGEIRQHGVCPDIDVPPTAIREAGTAKTHYVVDNHVVAYTPEQAATKAQRPGYPCQWSNTIFQWVDTRTLLQHKLYRWDYIKNCRTEREFAPFTWDGSQFDVDSASQARLQAAVQMALLAKMDGQTYSADWILTDNSVRTMSGADFFALAVAYVQYVRGLYQTSRQLRQAILAATTIEEVQAIDWPT